MSAELEQDDDMPVTDTAHWRDRAETAEAELAESDQVRDRMAQLLTETAAALKGPPPPLTMHDWSDLPRVAAAAVASRDQAEAEIKRLSFWLQAHAPTFPASESGEVVDTFLAYATAVTDAVRRRDDEIERWKASYGESADRGRADLNDHFAAWAGEPEQIALEATETKGDG